MRRYDAYRDSGVKWAGEIPVGWKSRRLKFVVGFTRGAGIKRDEVAENGKPCVRYGELYTTYAGAIEDVASRVADDLWLSSAKIDPGELVMALTGETKEDIGPTSVNLTDDRIAIGGDAVAIHPLGHHGRFLSYALNSNYMSVQKTLDATGEIVIHLGVDKLGNETVVLPPLSEQRAIADYLDAKTAEIDELMVDCEREIELLQEYRKAVISETVTKGLDPDAPMKDSGIEWIGEIPEHWGAGKLLRHARLESGHTPSKLHPEWWIEEECTVPWITTQDVHRFRDGRITSIDDTELHVSQAGLNNSSARWLPAGTVALSRTASVGFSVVLARPMASSQDFADWVPDETLDSFYLLYSLRSMDDVFRQLQMGSTHKTIYMPDIMKLEIAYPPLDEQRAIVSFLDGKTAEIDFLVDAKQQMVDKLREYRKSLISEAVTGKFKVPGVA